MNNVHVRAVEWTTAVAFTPLHNAVLGPPHGCTAPTRKTTRRRIQYRWRDRGLKDRLGVQSRGVQKLQVGDHVACGILGIRVKGCVPVAEYGWQVGVPNVRDKATSMT